MSVHVTMIKYFWREKGDLERYVNFDEAMEENPDIRRAWEEYKYKEHVLDSLIDDLEEPDEDVVL